MTHQEQEVLTLSSRREEPTPASVWYSLAGSSITDKFLDWPADMFAEVILGRSKVYRFLLSPPRGLDWPPSRISSWSEAVEEAGKQWSGVQDRKATFPELLAKEWQAFRERAEMPLEDLAEGRDWRMCEALLTLHAIADEACAGLGAALDGTDRKACIYRARGRELLEVATARRIFASVSRQSSISVHRYGRKACRSLGAEGARSPLDRSIRLNALIYRARGR
jgi:hypothetical protein